MVHDALKNYSANGVTEHGLDLPLKHDPLIVDTVGLGLDWTSGSCPPFGELDVDSNFDFMFGTLGSVHHFNFSTSDSSGISSGVSDTASPASYEASDGLPTMPFTFEPMQAFHLESPTTSIQAFDNVNFAPQMDHELPLGRFMATSPKSWESSSPELQPGADQKCMQRLSDLSIRLYEHSTTLPSHQLSDGKDKLQDSLAKAAYSEFNLDETFHLTQNLIDVYATFTDILKRQQGSISIPSGLDESSVLLISSCHLRLIKIYEELFPHMEVCIAQKSKTQSPQHSMAKISPSHLGGFQPSTSSNVSMQMMILVQLAKKLLDCSGDLSKVTQCLKEQDNKDDVIAARSGMSINSFDISVMTAQDVKGRAANMAQQLGTLQDLMLQMGIFA